MLSRAGRRARLPGGSFGPGVGSGD